MSEITKDKPYGGFRDMLERFTNIVLSVISCVLVTVAFVLTFVIPIALLVLIVRVILWMLTGTWYA